MNVLKKSAIKSESTSAFNKQINGLQSFLSILDDLDSNISEQIDDLNNYAYAKQVIDITTLPEQLHSLVNDVKRIHANIAMVNFGSSEELSKYKHYLSMPVIDMLNNDSYSYDINTNQLNGYYADALEYIHSFSDDDINEYKSKNVSENTTRYLELIISKYESERKQSKSTNNFKGSDSLWEMVDKFENILDAFLFDLNGQLEEMQNCIEPLIEGVEHAINGYSIALKQNLEAERKLIESEKERSANDSDIPEYKKPDYRPGQFRERFLTVRNPYQNIPEGPQPTHNNRKPGERFNTQRKSIIGRRKAFEIMNRALAQLGNKNG